MSSQITVNQILERKGHMLYAVTPEQSVYDALVTMAQHDVGALVVVEHNKLKGIFSERDYARKVILKGLDSRQLSIDAVMTQELYTVAPHTPLDELMEMMTEHHIRHLPVLDDQQNLKGMITIGDVVKAIMEEQKQTIRQLSGYIAGDLSSD